MRPLNDRQSTPASVAAAPSMGELEFRRFQKLIFEAAGIHLSPVKRTMVAGRLAKRLKVLGLADFVSYVRYVDQNQAEYNRVVDLLTTNETYFFREQKHFDYLRQVVLPERATASSVNVWSAACSSGEEPFSVAMLLADVRGMRNWKILASDISTQVLAKAKTGQFPLSRTEGIPQQYLKRFCLRGIAEESGTLLVDRALRNRVEFRQVNLMESLLSLPMFDLILLRNVLIYFQVETKNEVVKRVSGRLKPGGYLFIGHSESLNGLDCGLQQVAPAIFRKLP